MLQQAREFLFFEMFHDFADVLGAVARAEQDGVVCFYEDQILDADRCDEHVDDRQPVTIRRSGCQQALSARAAGGPSCPGPIRRSPIP